MTADGLRDRALAAAAHPVLLLLAVAYLLSIALTLVVIGWVVVTLPATYFQGPARARARPRSMLHGLGRVLKNVAGIALIGLGLLLSFPGIPGQGILTILVGLMLTDFPGRWRLERALVSRPAVLAAMNALRRRFGKPPLVVDS